MNLDEQNTERGWTIQERLYVTESERIAIGAWYGNEKMAPLAQVRRFVRANGTNGIEHVVNAYADLHAARLGEFVEDES